MHYFKILKHYLNPIVQKEMLSVAKDREVVGSSEDGSYLKRPDILSYPKDLEERVKSGAVAFHCSVERWSQPMQLSTALKPEELDNLRKGFDFIIDIDSKSKLEHAAIAAKVIHVFLKDLGITPTIKFSGSRGFHIAISSDAFPSKVDFKETSKRYPEIPQTIASYISEKVKDQILEELITFEGGVSSLINDRSVSELSAFEFVDIERNWGNRHLFRMPYSIHVKHWLVSLPIKFSDLDHFKKEMAKPENLKKGAEFLVNKEGEASNLLINALDWKSKQPKEAIKQPMRMMRRNENPIPEEQFPPCMKLILNGLADGKKRSLFTLLSFLRTMKWKPEDIEKRIMDWNSKNSPPLNDRTIKTQLKWHFRQERELMPANCYSQLFYTSIGVCKPDQYCTKNPVNYPFRLMRSNKRSDKRNT